MRIRLVYSKRGGACFVPHIALAQIFARSAVRAGFRLEMTQGFSPRAKLSFAPELPAGVVALNEVVDMYLAEGCGEVRECVGFFSFGETEKALNTSVVHPEGLCGCHADALHPEGLCASNPAVFADAMNASLPEGFRVSRVLFPPENSHSLGKSCKHAEYLIRNTHNIDFLDAATNFFGSAVLKAQHLDGWIRLILHDPAQNPIGSLIKHMIAQNLITGWHEMNIVRVSIGIYDSQKDCVCINA